MMDENEFWEHKIKRIGDVIFKVTEDYEKFVFKSMYPYCTEVAQQIVPKELLAKALTTYKAEHPEEWDMIMEKYISHTERGIDDEDDN